jgi:colicin import membrane protein
MSTSPENVAEPIAGTNLTTVPEYTETALALAELKQRFAKLVPDTSTPKGLASLTKDVAELRTLRTGIEKKRKELKAPLIAQEKKLDAEAARITSEIVTLEEPLKLQLDEANNRIEQAKQAKLEAERVRVEELKNVIFGIRETPASLIGKPSNIINGALVRLRGTDLTEEKFAEFYAEARDALDAAIVRVQSMHADAVEAEAQAERTRVELEELATLRREKEEREATDRQRAIDEQRQRDEAAQAERETLERKEREQARLHAERHERIRTIRNPFPTHLPMSSDQLRELMSSVASIDVSEDAFGDLWEEAERARADAIEAISDAIVGAEGREQYEAECSADRKRQADALEEQRKEQARVEEQQQAERDRLEQQQRDVSAKSERDRLASLGLREAAYAVVDCWKLNPHGSVELDNLIRDLETVLANDASPAKPSPRKRTKAQELQP